MKLGTLLLRDAVITLSQLEAALRKQVIHGGRLGTNLVELGFVDVDLISAYLSRVLDIPLATQEHFEKADPRALEAIGPGLADVYTAVPLFFEDESTLAVAMAEPKNRHTIEKLEMQSGLSIQPYIAPEMRLLYYLEKLYNINRKARFVRADEANDDDRRRGIPGRVDAPTSVPVIPIDSDLTIPVDMSQRRPRVTYEQTVDRIARSQSRDDIGEALIEFTVGRAGAAVLFIIRQASAVGWRFQSAAGSGMEDTVEELCLPLADTSVLELAYDTQEVYRGGPPNPDAIVERRLWEATGTRHEPPEVIVLPIKVKKQVVNLFYIHPLPADEFDEDFADFALDLCDRAGKAFCRLLDDSTPHEDEG